MHIRAVLLDVGGVFHLPDHDRILGALATVGIQARAEDLDRAHYAGVAGIDDFLEGDRSVWLAYQRSYAQACGSPDHRIEEIAEAMLTEFQSGAVWTRVITDSVDALRELKTLGMKLAVVSNADGTVEQQLRDDGIGQVGPGRGVELDAVLDSAVVGVSKPDPRIFELALERIGVTAEHAIHVGDIIGADVDGARAAGVTPVLMDPFDLHDDFDGLRVHSLREVVELVR
jgi:putative hydrolase of the HAD superfamily